MNTHQKRRLIFIFVVISVIAAAAGLALYALQQNINLFFSPTQVMQGLAPDNQAFRLGGLVAKNSVHHGTRDSLQVSFQVTDNNKAITVIYDGVLPDLFREGQSVVVEGRLSAQKIIIADQVLAKHDEKYIPIQVKKMIRKTAI